MNLPLPIAKGPQAAVPAIRPRDRDALIQALRAGVVPRVGQHWIQVGRARELATLLGDIDRIADGGSAFRLVTGAYGAGKTFFLNLVRAMALERKLVVANADLNPDRRLHATEGQARSLYAELMRNTSTRPKPDGGALPGIVEKFIMAVRDEAKVAGRSTETVLRSKLAALAELVNGYDFAQVIEAYWKGHEEGNEQLQSDAVRWLRGEFSTRTDARRALGVRTIVDDADVYDQLKLLARFVRLAGYGGLLVCLDELVNLYKLGHSQARNANYEQLLRMLNDSLQGYSEGLGFVLGGTPEFLLDPRRGLYSYPALQSRLAENAFAKGDLVDFSGPVVRLASLRPEDLFVLLEKVGQVVASGSPGLDVPRELIASFMAQAAQRLGEQYFRTPRTTITAFINLLAIIQQNQGVVWTDLIESVEFSPDTEATGEAGASPLQAGSAQHSEGGDDELHSFKL